MHHIRAGVITRWKQLPGKCNALNSSPVLKQNKIKSYILCPVKKPKMYYTSIYLHYFPI